MGRSVARSRAAYTVPIPRYQRLAQWRSDRRTDFPTLRVMLILCVRAKHKTADYILVKPGGV